MTNVEAGRMRAAVYREKRRLVVEERPVPQPGPHDVVLRVSHCGVCGSDLHLVMEGWGRPDSIGGHEYSGRIAALGSGVKDWELGAPRGGRARGGLRSLRVLRDAPAQPVREPRHAGRLRVPGGLRGVRARARVAAPARFRRACRCARRRSPSRSRWRCTGSRSRRSLRAGARWSRARGRSACSRSRRCARRASAT